MHIRRAFSAAGPTVWNSTRQPPRPGSQQQQQQLQATTSNALLSTLSAVEILYDSALYKCTMDIDTDIDISSGCQE